MLNVTLGKRTDPPAHSGWQGYSDRVPVYLDGAKIGELVGRGHNKSKLEYGLDTEHAALAHYPKMMQPVGLKAAREAVKKAVAKTGGER